MFAWQSEGLFENFLLQVFALSHSDRGHFSWDSNIFFPCKRTPSIASVEPEGLDLTGPFERPQPLAIRRLPSPDTRGWGELMEIWAVASLSCLKRCDDVKTE